MCCWTIHREQLQVALLLISLDQRELDRRIMELLDVVTTSLDCSDFLNFNDLKGDENIAQLALII